jgi:hypothetical protein
MAEAMIHWLREDVSPATADLGEALQSLVSDASFDCRGRNRVAGAKLSEHGRANALDIRAFTARGGKSFHLADPFVPRDFRERLRQSACTRFNTVLGPGSDGYHEHHIHLDLAQRSSGYRMCQWDVRTPVELVSVPLPPERPREASSEKR